jgi:AcrR family transcriptional regulator
MLINDHAHRRRTTRQGDVRHGLRERNKEKKLERIARAGRALFVQKGFEETTTRAIATKAGVGVGTFFLYFGQKRDLLFHLFRDEVSAAVEDAFASTPPAAGIVQQLTHVFGRLYAYYGRDPRLSRVFMKELLFLEAGENHEMMALTRTFVGRVAALVDGAKDRGRVERSVDASQVAAHAFALYLFGLIAWLGGVVPAPEMAQAQLEAQLQLLIRGISPSRS